MVEERIAEDITKAAIASLVGHLALTQASSATFPRLSEKARWALAELVVRENGYLDLSRNKVDAVNRAMRDSEIWTYYGFAGSVRRFIKKFTGQKL